LKIAVIYYSKSNESRWQKEPGFTVVINEKAPPGLFHYTYSISRTKFPYIFAILDLKSAKSVLSATICLRVDTAVSFIAYTVTKSIVAVQFIVSPVRPVTVKVSSSLTKLMAGLTKLFVSTNVSMT
jgi:hypothetical protein